MYFLLCSVEADGKVSMHHEDVSVLFELETDWESLTFKKRQHFPELLLRLTAIRYKKARITIL